MVPVEEACEEHSVAALYQDAEVAGTYVEQRFSRSWTRLLHDRQVAQVNQAIHAHQPELVMEVAPGPARLTTEIRGVTNGVLVEYSHEMLAEAKQRLERAGVGSIWDVRHGNAFELKGQNVQCDFLYTFRFIRHFHEEDRTRIYQNIRTCLKPGGLLMFDVVNRTVREKRDARNRNKAKQELEVYDVTYTPAEFSAEMKSHGFEVISFVPVIRHFELQSWVTRRLDRRIGQWAHRLVRVMETIPSANPLEWVVLCRRDHAV